MPTKRSRKGGSSINSCLGEGEKQIESDYAVIRRRCYEFYSQDARVRSRGGSEGLRKLLAEPHGKRRKRTLNASLRMADRELNGKLCLARAIARKKEKGTDLEAFFFRGGKPAKNAGDERDLPSSAEEGRFESPDGLVLDHGFQRKRELDSVSRYFNEEEGSLLPS